MKRLGIVLLAAAMAACSDQTDGVFQGYAEGEYLRVASPLPGSLRAFTWRAVPQ